MPCLAHDAKLQSVLEHGHVLQRGGHAPERFGGRAGIVIGNGVVERKRQNDAVVGRNDVLRVFHRTKERIQLIVNEADGFVIVLHNLIPGVDRQQNEQGNGDHDDGTDDVGDRPAVQISEKMRFSSQSLTSRIQST